MQRDAHKCTNRDVRLIKINVSLLQLASSQKDDMSKHRIRHIEDKMYFDLPP